MDKLLKYVVCKHLTYHPSRESSWLKSAPLTIGKVYEIGKVIVARNFKDDDEYQVLEPDEKRFNDGITISRSNKEYYYPKTLFREATQEEITSFKRDKKLNDIGI
jgi:hypothetical protein